MDNITQPFVNLTTANAQLIARFAQSQEIAELANTNAQKYLELAQKTFGGPATNEAYVELVRSLTENYMTFAREHAQSLMGLVAEGQTQLAERTQAAVDRIGERVQVAAAAVGETSRPRGARSK